jgi:DNA polymerase III epsilon subunit-like protein
MNYLFFDTETTGLPGRMDAPASDLDNWPRIVQLAWQLRRKDGRFLSARSSIIQPEGFTIPDQAADVHGITTARAIAEGEPLYIVLEAFAEDIADADFIVAHNYDFDAPICGAEFLRIGYSNYIESTPAYCTQKQTTQWAQIPQRSGARGYGRYKWPSLAELHAACGGGEIENAHNASADVEATANCFFHLLRIAPEVFSQPYFQP